MGERLVGGVTSVRIGRGVLGAVCEGSEPLVVVLTQPGAAEYAATIVADCESRGTTVVQRVLPDAEAAKTLATTERLVEWMAGEGVRRDAVIVGVGGGALTDAVGFVAAVYLRGVEVRYVPTTLLCAVDAAIGGKTAVNVAGKNLVGAFRHPERVVVDVDILDRLPEERIREGMAEVIKAGVVGDPGLLSLVNDAGPATDLEQIVERAIDVKARIVDADFRESGVRAHLNFGHTIGHAIESLAGTSHGEAVAMGMVAAARISERVHGFEQTSVVVRAIERAGLPVRSDPLDRSKVLALAEKDKKHDAGGLRMVLLEAIGRPVVSRVDMATLVAGLDAIGIGES